MPNLGMKKKGNNLSNSSNTLHTHGLISLIPRTGMLRNTSTNAFMRLALMSPFFSASNYSCRSMCNYNIHRLFL
jgi:hypothetical protein